MSWHIVLAGFVACVSYLLWPILRPLIIESPLSKIPGPPRKSFLLGNFTQIFNRNGWKFHFDIVKQYGTTLKVNFFLGDERLYTIDPLALHHIFVKHQYIYEETPFFLTVNRLQFGTSLLSTLGTKAGRLKGSIHLIYTLGKGEHHRKQRKMLNPVFSLKHMRGLLPIFYPVTHELRDVLVRKVKNGEEEINVMEWISRAAMEYIGRGGFGHTFDALNENTKSEYGEAVKMLVPLASTMFAFRPLLPTMTQIGTPSFRRKVVEWTPIKRVQQLRSIIDIMHDTSIGIYSKKVNAFKEGDEAVKEQIGNGKDIMSILLRANLEASEEDRLPDDEILGQIGTFVFAGHDTTTGALCRVFHQLVLHPDVQERLRAEVTAARKDGDLGYDELMSLPYLDAVCRESLRMFPPLPTVQRITRQDVALPLLYPVKTTDGNEIKEIPLKKDTGVVISIMNVNRHKAIWGVDADEWKPERWLKPLPESVAAAHLPGVYASMMTFIGGGRACIGFKFAEMEMKLALSILLETFVFSSSGSKEIEWMMAGLNSPVIKGSNDITPQMPLKLSLVKP